MNLKNIFAKVKLLVLDFDGVLTDGYVYFDQNGKETVRCSRRDSLGIEMLQKKGIKVVVISKETNPIVAARCKKMKVECFCGIDTKEDKLAVLKEYVHKNGYTPEEICFMGDDVNDISCMEYAGISITVADGHNKNKKIADYVTKRNGGCHAVREICDLILEGILID